MTVDERIIQLVAKLQRYRQGGVFAYMVQAQLDEYRAEQTLRRDMYRLWCAGRLERLGGHGSRRGYRVPAGGAETFREGFAAGATASELKRRGDSEAEQAARRAIAAARAQFERAGWTRTA